MSNLIPFYAGGAVAVTLVQILIDDVDPFRSVVAGAAWPIWVLWGLYEKIRG